MFQIIRRTNTRQNNNRVFFFTLCKVLISILRFSLCFIVYFTIKSIKIENRTISRTHSGILVSAPHCLKSTCPRGSVFYLCVVLCFLPHYFISSSIVAFHTVRIKQFLTAPPCLAAAFTLFRLSVSFTSNTMPDDLSVLRSKERNTGA